MEFHKLFNKYTCTLQEKVEDCMSSNTWNFFWSKFISRKLLMLLEWRVLENHFLMHFVFKWRYLFVSILHVWNFYLKKIPGRLSQLGRLSQVHYCFLFQALAFFKVTHKEYIFNTFFLCMGDLCVVCWWVIYQAHIYSSSKINIFNTKIKSW